MVDNPFLPDDLNRSEGKRDIPLEYVLSFMQYGDVLKLKKGLRVGEFAWPDANGVVWDQSELSVAQLILVRRYKFVLPRNLALFFIHNESYGWDRMFKRVRERYYNHYKCGEDLPSLLKPDVKT